MLLQEQEELWLQDSKKFWSIITSRDKPNHLRYTGQLKGSRTRKVMSKKPLPRGQDVYMSLLPLDKVGKSSNNITYFNILWVDLDFNSPYEMFDSGAEERLKKLREPPNIIIFSGKGLWALWFIEPVNKNEWLILQKNLVQEIKTKLKIENMYVDTKVINPLKFIRIPGSINSKTGQVVSYKILDLKIKKKFSKDKDMEKEHKATIKVTMNSKEYSKPKDYSKNKVLRLETLYNLNLTRIDDLEKILDMGYIEKGNRNEYLHIYSCQLVLLGREKDYIMSKLKEINKIQKWFLHESELRYVVNSAIRNKYKYKNDTIINKLGLDIEIQSKLEIIRTSDEEEKKEIKKIKDKEKKKANRRNEGGLTEKEQNKKDTYESIQALKSKGLTQMKVAKQLGIGRATVQRHWK